MGQRMTAWRYVTDDAVGAAEGLAMDEALLTHHAATDIPPFSATLRLYTYRSHCALVGRYQSLEDEVDLEACGRRGVAISRRPTGGGAILMGADQLGVAVCTQAPAGLSSRAILQRYANGVIAGLTRLGVSAIFRNKNDLEVGGRKIAGLGLCVDDRGALLFHASVLADLDIALMLDVLRIPGAKLSDKAVARVAERIGTVSEIVGTRVAGSDIRNAVAAGFADALGVQLVPGEPDVGEVDRMMTLTLKKYGDATWVRQDSPLPDARGTALLKTPEGLLRFYIGVHGDTIKSLLVTGDFNTLPPSVPRLEAAVRWCHAHPGRISDVCRQTAVEAELGVPVETVAGAVWEATARALRRQQRAQPVRARGSCYFPSA